MPSAKTAEEKRQRAQLHFEKSEQRRVEAAKAVDDHLARNKAEAAKTARLRALRLAKEAADKLAALSAAQDPTRKKTAKRKKPPADAS